MIPNKKNLGGRRHPKVYCFLIALRYHNIKRGARRRHRQQHQHREKKTTWRVVNHKRL